MIKLTQEDLKQLHEEGPYFASFVSEEIPNLAKGLFIL